MAGALVPISGLPSSLVVASSDILALVLSGTTKKMTAGTLRTDLFAFAAADPLNIGPLTAVGNSTITGTLSGITTLTATTLLGVASTLTNTTGTTLTLNSSTNNTTDYTQILFQRGGATFWRIGQNEGGGNADALQIYRDGVGVVLNVDTAGAPVFQGSLGVLGTTTLVGLNVSGALSMTAAAARIVGGGTSLALRNNANNADNVLVSDAGVVTLRSSLVFATAAGKIIPGATSLTFRNAADTFDNVSIVDAGDVTVNRGNLTVTLGGILFPGVGGGVSIGGSAVLGPRLTGYTNVWTGAAANKATGYDASTITLPQLAARVRAIQESLTTHGMIGV